MFNVSFSLRIIVRTHQFNWILVEKKKRMWTIIIIDNNQNKMCQYIWMNWFENYNFGWLKKRFCVVCKWWMCQNLLLILPCFCVCLKIGFALENLNGIMELNETRKTASVTANDKRFWIHLENDIIFRTSRFGRGRKKKQTKLIQITNIQLSDVASASTMASIKSVQYI